MVGGCVCVVGGCVVCGRVCVCVFSGYGCVSLCLGGYVLCTVHCLASFSFININTHTHIHTPFSLQVFKEEEEAVKVELHEGCGRIKLYWTMALADYRTLKGMIEFRETGSSK